MVKTSYNKNKHDFDIAWPGRVARHDLVYLSPPSDPMQYGMPVGNGDIGALVWCDERRIIIAFNKCDLWDDAAFGSFHNWKREEEESSTTLRHACRIVIDFGMPVFDTFYLEDFEARLRLQNGCIQMRLEGPFGNLQAEIFVTYEGSVLCARITTDFAEDDGIEITMERYGSRTFPHWYSFRTRDASLGLGETKTWTKEGNLLLSHKLSTGDFICALRPEGDGLKTTKRTSHMVSAHANVCPREIMFYALCTSPFEEGNDEKNALSTLEQASEKGFDALLVESEACWKQFWERSFIETDDDYLDNLWHLAMYYSCAGQRGSYPGRFINSLWNWNRDVQPWNFYFHWNQQEIYWGLNAAGHHELCDSYLDYRFRGMEHAREDALRLFGVKDGLFVSDVCERRGYNSEGEKHNHTPVGEIALDFWRQYLYTGDMEFLKNKALPYMLGAAKFFASLFVKEEDGKYHAKGGSAYEGLGLVYDPITELAMAKVLFGAVLQALKITGASDPNQELYREIKENVVSLKMLDADSRIIKGNDNGTGTIQLGMFKGKEVSCCKVFSLGRVKEKNNLQWFDDLVGQHTPQYFSADEEPKKEKLLDGTDIVLAMLHEPLIPTNVVEELKTDYSAHHPQANVAPVFPMGVIGIKDKGSESYDTAVTTALVSRNSQMMGWDPMPIVLARLGLADELDAYIYDFPSVWQYYNNGFCHYGGNAGFVADKVSPFRRNLVEDANTGETFAAETFPFRHMGLEALGVFSATMNERLLQSYDGVIRIVPAYGSRNARFKLHAVGGFEVMSEISEGVPAFVAIRSMRGEKLQLANPWEKAWCNSQIFTDEIIIMDTEAGKTYLFTPDGEEAFEYAQENPLPNGNCKVRPDKNAMLGLGRSF